MSPNFTHDNRLLNAEHVGAVKKADIANDRRDNLLRQELKRRALRATRKILEDQNPENAHSIRWEYRSPGRNTEDGKPGSLMALG